MWDVASGKELEAQIMNGHENVIETVVWLPPAAVETVLACAEFEGQFPAAGPKPQMLLSGARDKTIRLWDASTGSCLKVYVRSSVNSHFRGLVVDGYAERLTRRTSPNP